MLAEKLIKHYNLNPPTYEKSNDNKWDIKLSNNMTYELKCDTVEKTTKHVFIEYYSRSKPSGISTSKADYYVFCFDNITFNIIPTKKLKILIINNTASYKIMQTKNSKTFGYLVPVDDIFNNCKLII